MKILRHLFVNSRGNIVMSLNNGAWYEFVRAFRKPAKREGK